MELSDSGGNFPARRGFYEPAPGARPAPLRPPAPPPPRCPRACFAAVCRAARLWPSASVCLPALAPQLCLGSLCPPPSLAGCPFLSVFRSVPDSLSVRPSVRLPVLWLLSLAHAICWLLLLSLFLPLTWPPFLAGPHCFTLGHQLITPKASLGFTFLVCLSCASSHPKPFPSGLLAFPPPLAYPQYVPVGSEDWGQPGRAGKEEKL